MTVNSLVSFLVVGNAIACLVCTYYAVCAINAMSRRTKLLLWLAFIGQGLGWFCQGLAAIDFFHGDALGWPWFLLSGVLLANAGAAAIYLANRRDCSCAGCPARRSGDVDLAKLNKRLIDDLNRRNREEDARIAGGSK